MKTCPDCGERVYALGCVNCNEDAYIEQQRQQDADEPDLPNTPNPTDPDYALTASAEGVSPVQKFIDEQRDLPPEAAKVLRENLHELYGAEVVSPVQKLQREIDLAWEMIENGWDIEPRAYFEKDALTNGFGSALAQAVHHMWKRDVKTHPKFPTLTAAEVVSQPPQEEAARGSGKAFSAYQKFCASVKRGERAIVFGPDYVVVSRNKWDELTTSKLASGEGSIPSPTKNEKR